MCIRPLVGLAPWISAYQRGRANRGEILSVNALPPSAVGEPHKFCRLSSGVPRFALLRHKVPPPPCVCRTSHVADLGGERPRGTPVLCSNLVRAPLRSLQEAGSTNKMFAQD